jgi:hypothetical protein
MSNRPLTMFVELAIDVPLVLNHGVESYIKDMELN